MEDSFLELGRIILWPGGYAMTLGYRRTSGCARCCEGHETPEGAKNHGLVRLIEVATKQADNDIATWATRTDVA